MQNKNERYNFSIVSFNMRCIRSRPCDWSDIFQLYLWIVRAHVPALRARVNVTQQICL